MINYEDAMTLFEKMKRLIDTSSIEDKKIVERYLSLANREIHTYSDIKNPCNMFGIVGASMGLKCRFESKFGDFIWRENGIKL